MNDFTKEELICIRDHIVVPQSNEEKSIIYNAYHKLLGMIDNYCEHENDTRFNAIPIDGSPKMCTKCEMFYI